MLNFSILLRNQILPLMYKKSKKNVAEKQAHRVVLQTHARYTLEIPKRKKAIKKKSQFLTFRDFLHTYCVSCLCKQEEKKDRENTSQDEYYDPHTNDGVNRPLQSLGQKKRIGIPLFKTRRKGVKRLHSGTTSDKSILI